jgi:RND family efflux transporter MFP subunit
MQLKLLTFGLTILVTMGAVNCSNDERKGGGGEAASPAAPSARALQPRPIAPQTENLEILSVLSVEHSVELLAQTDGIVKEINDDQNSWVQPGAVLARLDDRELLAKLDRARAGLEIARNNLKYQQAETQAKDAAYHRQLELRKYGLSSQAAEEEAEFLSKGAHYDVDSYTATVKEKEAEIHELEVGLEKTRILAPFEGCITQRSIRLGQTVVKNDPCFRLSQLAPLQVRFLVPEASGKAPQLGDRIRVVPVGDSSHEYEAEVKSLSPTIDPASMSYDVTGQLTRPDLKRLRPGLAVKVLWPARSEPQAP